VQMVEEPERTPIRLEYSRMPARKSSWPIGLYTIALFWAFFTMRWQTAATTYREESFAFRTQIVLLVCAALRLVWARLRRDQGKQWRVYVLLLLFSPFLWGLFAPLLARLGRTFRGGHY
jgi:hypothetical protein